MTISLIVKGNRFEAMVAATQRGIPFVFCEQHRDEVVAWTGEQHRDKVVAWFAEAPHAAPFPVGTLLLFTETK
jgi:hypothetical protein